MHVGSSRELHTRGSTRGLCTRAVRTRVALAAAGVRSPPAAAAERGPLLLPACAALDCPLCALVPLRRGGASASVADLVCTRGGGGVPLPPQHLGGMFGQGVAAVDPRVLLNNSASPGGGLTPPTPPPPLK